ncbi:hypothetical protein BH11PLA1_BH11PLA1_21890 [soil metagenome]
MLAALVMSLGGRAALAQDAPSPAPTRASGPESGPVSAPPGVDLRPVAPGAQPKSGASARPSADVPTVRPVGGDAPYAGARRLKFDDLRRVYGGASDVSPLDAQLASMPKDLRIPNNFHAVYQIPRDAPTPYAGWFVRLQGSTWAVFPQSVYVTTKEGTSVPVPPGTQYFVGGVPLTEGAEWPIKGRPSVTVERQDNSVDSRAASDEGTVITRAPGTRVNDASAGPAVARELATKGVKPGEEDAGREAAAQRAADAERLMVDEAYRARRVGVLMGRIAERVVGR